MISAFIRENMFSMRRFLVAFLSPEQLQIYNVDVINKKKLQVNDRKNKCECSVGNDAKKKSRIFNDQMNG